MKAIIFFLSISVFFSLSSCKKTENQKAESQKAESQKIESGLSFKALKNDANWVSTFSWANYSKSEKKIYVGGTVQDKKYCQEEQLTFNFHLSDISKSNTVTSFKSEWLYIIGGDAISDSYLIDTTEYNLIQITSFDTIKKQISGTFVIKLNRDKHYSNEGEFFQFKDGVFNVKYIEIN
jgi:hypothetical protein